VVLRHAGGRERVSKQQPLGGKKEEKEREFSSVCCCRKKRKRKRRKRFLSPSGVCAGDEITGKSRPGMPTGTY
jgi:hypothetical protein